MTHSPSSPSGPADPPLSYPLMACAAGQGQMLAPFSGTVAPGYTPFAQEEEPSLDLRRYLGILLHRKWLLVFAVILALILGLTLTIRETPIYRATAVVEARPPVINPYGYSNFSAYGGSLNFVGDQIQILKSAALAQRVAREFRIDMPPASASTGAAPSGFFAELKAQLEAWLAPATPPAAEEEPLSRPGDDPLAANQAALEGAVQGRLQVVPVPQTNLLKVSMDDEDPRRAAALANAVAKAFVAMNQERRSQGSNQSEDFFDTQVRKTRAELEDLERKLIAYARGRDLVSLDNLLEYHEKEFGQLKSQLFEADQRLYQAESRFQAMKEAGGTGGEDFLKSEVIQQLKTRRGQLEDEYQLKLETFLPEYPKMVQLRSQIAAIDKQIAEESRSIAKSIQITYEAAKHEKASLEQRVAEGRTALLTIRDQTADYNALKREQTALQSVYDGLMKRIKESGIVSDVGGNNISILDVATVPGKPFTPDLQANLLKALGLGLVMGVLLIALVEKLDDTVKSAEEAERLLGVPILGSYPFVAVDPKGYGDDPPLMTWMGDPRSPMAEAGRSLRTTLAFTSAGGAPKVVHFTSAAPNEGKSVATCSTAMAFARGGAKVLCIDADLRNPSLHRVFDVQNDQGLSNYLVSDIQPAELTQATAVEGLYLITSGPLPPNPVELLASGRMVELLRLAELRFDFVFVDGPPVLGLADALVISMMTGATLFVIEPGKTRKGALADSMKRMRSSQARVIGGVFQKMGKSGSGYGYGYGYGYKYNYQYLYGYGQSGHELERT